MICLTKFTHFTSFHKMQVFFCITKHNTNTHNWNVVSRNWRVLLLNLAFGYSLHPWGRVYVPQSHWQDLWREVDEQPFGQVAQLPKAKTTKARPGRSSLCHWPLCRLRKYPIFINLLMSNSWKNHISLTYLNILMNTLHINKSVP